MNKRKIKLRYDRDLRPVGVNTTSLTLNSSAELVVLVSLPQSGLLYSWITPGNNKLGERPLFRDESLDEGGYAAYTAEIYPNMTTGVISDVGYATITISTERMRSSNVRIPVMNSIIPESSNITPSVAEELVRKINELEKRIAQLERAGDV